MNSSIRTTKNCPPFKQLLVHSVLILALALAAVSQVQAHGQRNRHSDSEWRLGSHNQIYQRTYRGWQRVPGYATAVADGWVLGTDRRGGGYGIYRWNGRSFDRMPGAAVNIGGSYERPWVRNDRGEHFEWTGRDWRRTRSYR